MKSSQKKLSKSFLPEITFKNFIFFVPFISALLLFSVTGCNKDPFELNKIAKNQNVSSVWCLPVVHGKLKIEDLVTDSSTVTQDENGLITFVYESSVSSDPVLEYLNTSDINHADDFSFDMPEYVPPGDTVFAPFSQYVNFELSEGQRIDSALLSSCTIQFDFSTDINKDAYVEITIPGAVKEGAPYTKQFQYNYQTGGVITKTIDLSGYHVTFTHQGSQYNLLKVETNIYVISNEEPNNSPYTFHIEENISNISLQRLYGYAGQIEFPLYSDTINIDLYQAHLRGHINLVNPVVTITAKNGAGAPAGLTFASLKAHYPGQPGGTIEIEGPGLPEEWIINYPQTENRFAYTQFELNAENSNISDVIENSPDYLTIEVSGVVNPENVVMENFANENSTVTLTAEIEMPLYGSTGDLTLEDSYEFYFEENLQEIETATFNVVFTNAFPMDVNMQLYFLDSQTGILDSLFTQPQTIEHGETDNATMHVNNPAETLFTVNFTAERLNRIKQETAAIKIRSLLKTPNSNPVKIFSDNYLGFQIGVKYNK